MGLGGLLGAIGCFRGAGEGYRAAWVIGGYGAIGLWGAFGGGYRGMWGYRVLYCGYRGNLGL